MGKSVTDRIVLDLTHESSVPLVSNTLEYTYFILTQLVPRLAGSLYNTQLTYAISVESLTLQNTINLYFSHDALI